MHLSAAVGREASTTLVLGEAAVVIWTCVASRSSQSIGCCFAQPSELPVPFQLDQSKSMTPHPLVDCGSVGPVSARQPAGQSLGGLQRYPDPRSVRVGWGHRCTA